MQKFVPIKRQLPANPYNYATVGDYGVDADMWEVMSPAAPIQSGFEDQDWRWKVDMKRLIEAIRRQRWNELNEKELQFLRQMFMRFRGPHNHAVGKNVPNVPFVLPNPGPVTPSGDMPVPPYSTGLDMRSHAWELHRRHKLTPYERAAIQQEQGGPHIALPPWEQNEKQHPLTARAAHLAQRRPPAPHSISEIYHVTHTTRPRHSSSPDVNDMPVKPHPTGLAWPPPYKLRHHRTSTVNRPIGSQNVVTAWQDLAHMHEVSTPSHRTHITHTTHTTSRPHILATTTATKSSSSLAAKRDDAGALGTTEYDNTDLLS